MKSMRCCIPNCSLLSNQTNLKHVAFYGIKPMWHKLIIEYITKPGNKQTWKLRSNVICGKHYRLCGIKDMTASTVFFFPRLRISVSHYSRKPLNFKSLYSSEDIIVDHEEIFPPVMEVNMIDLSKQKKLIAPKRPTKHVDHNYAVNLEYIQFLKDEYEMCIEERETDSKKTLKIIENCRAEIQRLKVINHDLLKTNMSQETLAYPLRLIPDNEQLLKFYTGFSKRDDFQKFVEMLEPEYFKVRKREAGEVRKQHLGMVPQLVLVLSRLRLGLMHNDLAYRFNISLTTVLKIWMFWIKLLTDVLVTNCEFNYDKNTHKVIVECYETFFETSKDNKTKAEKTYGRARALIELNSNGLVIKASDLFASYVTNEQIIKSWSETKVDKPNNGNSTKQEPVGKPSHFSDLQTHVQKILGFVKGFKILKGTFPNSVTSVKQLNVFWKICCFLVNYTCPELMDSTKRVK